MPAVRVQHLLLVPPWHLLPNLHAQQHVQQ
jgi:hypothetical protein